MGALCLGLAWTTLGCAKGANTFDDTVNGSGGATGATTCGNGVVDPNEQCDPKVAITMTCTLMTGVAGPVMCNPVTCMFDTSLCATTGGVAGH
jgi:hypothetical protein